ncbi:phage tail tape measure protein [Thermoleptolyngbya sp. M55_K2018_002]|uniref:phage tail tape measure protein n=1 Tax=Thermoleptolyngbya sp. M55_K2018_002 TaxID=2747808 RepID=UPI0019E1BFC9|nr:phage tail tape measure protein [Thermoleptolyngbya sp. M55_K2018_002]HIK42154.1 phage tail tape measure protein [Thermoleptolyngbya sp. M55_K2018_002]
MSEKLQILIEALNNASGPIREVQQQIEALSNQSFLTRDLGRSITDLGDRMTNTVSRPIQNALTTAAHAAMDFESAMVGTNRAVGADTQAEINATRDTVMRLSQELGILPTAMADLVAEAGKLGIAAPQIEDYNRLVAQTGVAFDMSTDQSGAAIAKLTNVLGYMDSQGRVNIEGLRQLNATIDYLGDSGATSQSAIVNVLGRAGGAARQFGLTNTEAAGLATAFLNLGDAPEVVGTALVGMLPKLQNATRQTSGFQETLAEIGISAKDMESAIKQDASGAFLDLMDRIQASGNASGIIQGLFGSGSDSAMLAKAVSNVEQFRKTIESAEGVDVGRLGGSFETASATSGAALARLKTSMSILSIEIGSVLLPAIAQIAQGMTPIVQKIAEFARANPGIVKIGVALALVAAAIGPVLVAVGSLVSAFGAIGGAIAGIKGFMLAIAAIKAGVLPAMGLAGALVKVGAIIGGIGLGPIVAIGAGLAAAAYLVIRNWQPISGFFAGLFASIQSAIAPMVAGISQFFAGFAQGFAAVIPAAAPAIAQLQGFFAAMAPSLMVAAQGIAQMVAGMMQFGLAIAQLTPVGMLIQQIGAAFNSAGFSAASFGAMVGGAIAVVVSAIAQVIGQLSAMVAATAGAAAQMVGIITGLAGRFYSAGAQLMQRLAAGITAGIGAVTGAIGAVAARIAAALPGSPVREGILRSFNSPASSPGAELIRMLGRGMQAVPVQPFMQSALSPLSTPSGGGVQPAVSGRGRWVWRVCVGINHRERG